MKTHTLKAPASLLILSGFSGGQDACKVPLAACLKCPPARAAKGACHGPGSSLEFGMTGLFQVRLEEHFLISRVLVG